MTAKTIITTPVFKPEISFDVRTEIFEEKATIVHCSISQYARFRIWPTTYLVQDNGVRKQLQFAYHIGAYPKWMEVPPGHRFTLVFEPLDKDCKVFDIFEDIPEPGGFHWHNLHRNAQDVYEVGIEWWWKYVVYQ